MERCVCCGTRQASKVERIRMIPNMAYKQIFYIDDVSLRMSHHLRNAVASYQTTNQIYTIEICHCMVGANEERTYHTCMRYS